MDRKTLYRNENPILFPNGGFGQAVLHEIYLEIKRGGYRGFLVSHKGRLVAYSITKRTNDYKLRVARGWKNYDFVNDRPGYGQAKQKKTRRSTRTKTLEERLAEELEAFKAQQAREFNTFCTAQAVAMGEFIRRQAEHRNAERKHKEDARRANEQREQAQRQYEEARRRRHEEEARRQQSRQANPGDWRDWYRQWANEYANAGSQDYQQQARARSVPPQSRQWWDVLGIPSTATAEEAKRAWKAAQFKTHPDRGGSHEAFIEVGNAWQVAQRHFGMN